ncbi:histidine phosphatase family protein [Streptomyces sp. NPDC048664]|uniref:histidine phosphatase family protein n=1 Tax=Streptomyces sp. NPDC048664 TaxID=3154505 RepID=UPI003423996B
MTCRVIFISPASSSSLRRARFDDGDPLDEAGAAQAAAAAGQLRAPGRAFVSPSVRSGQTAAALGLDAVAERALAGLDVGRWRGRTLDEVAAAEPSELARWMADPDAAPHGGESVRDLCGRVAGWLAEDGESDGRTVAVVEPEVVRAVVVQVLGAPESAFWHVDVPPLAATEISGRSGRWNLRVGRVLGPSD